MSIGSEAARWLNESFDEQPPKGWYCAREIANKKKASMPGVKMQLDAFVKNGQIKQSKKFKVGRSIKTYYDLTGFKF